MTLEGQWIGRVSGTNIGTVILDLELREGTPYGSAFLFEDDPGVPGTLALIRTDKVGKEPFEATLAPLAPSGAVLAPAEMQALFPDMDFPTSAVLDLSADQNGDLDVTWASNIRTNGSGKIYKSHADQLSNIVPLLEIETWEDFKRFALDQEPRRHIYRGQSITKRLRTTFHRTWRKDLVKFLQDDILHLHHAITSKSRHFFDLTNNLHNGAFWNLIQHHGFPTPLLDWSHSPFVAAFFAFREKRDPDLHGDMVRIFVFDRANWMGRYAAHQSVTYSPPHFTILEALPIENPRAIPQQAISAVTNIDDVESLIAAREAQDEQTYLRAINLPYSSRGEVMRELELMGISAASLLPGFDGICEQMKGRFFGF